MKGVNHNGRAWVEIDLDRLSRNYRTVKDLVGRDCKILVAVKADAYGHGAVEISKTLQEDGVDMLGVASVDEALELTRGGIHCPIVILSPTVVDLAPVIVENDFRINVSNMAYAQHLSRTALAMGTRARVHVEIDTGMGRTGVLWREGLEFINAIAELEGIALEGIFTHFAVADEDRQYTEEQVEKFSHLLERIEKHGIRIPLTHCANSAGILDYPSSYLNMVRPGLVIYGLFPSSTPRPRGISPIMSFRTRIVHIQNVPRGTSISYGRTFLTERDSTIATISVGYGDGYSRRLSNQGEVIVRGKRARIVGTVCMDLTMVDCTHFDGVRLGDEVTLIGRDGTEEITPDEIAGLIGTISYEVTSSIGPRVPRVFVRNGAPQRVKSLLGNEDCVFSTRHD
ncbi:hypothetical protein AMJ40_03650 [candidate division TA06 bacterium DG_26]|uniref:Alanine racemase n=1 Tax=candidate division TA06 bacterium DG_26 TaxID=1703771 RepID=A0A0S7WJ23_UNCT6|nr:MAG: hypothetical protein AMJ40_03650 [candidate division TA06 bacterium DG_26]